MAVDTNKDPGYCQLCNSTYLNKDRKSCFGHNRKAVDCRVVDNKAADSAAAPRVEAAVADCIAEDKG